MPLSVVSTIVRLTDHILRPKHFISRGRPLIALHSSSWYYRGTPWTLPRTLFYTYPGDCHKPGWLFHRGSGPRIEHLASVHGPNGLFPVSTIYSKFGTKFSQMEDNITATSKPDVSLRVPVQPHKGNREKAALLQWLMLQPYHRLQCCRITSTLQLYTFLRISHRMPLSSIIFWQGSSLSLIDVSGLLVGHTLIFRSIY